MPEQFLNTSLWNIGFENNNPGNEQVEK